MEIQPQFQLPSFTLYRIKSTSKYCYEDDNTKLICSIQGPYLDNRKQSMNQIYNQQPYFEIHNENVIHSKQMKQILHLMVIPNRYQRMFFEIYFQNIGNQLCAPSLPAFINLLCYTVVMQGIQVKSIFTAYQGCILNGKFLWNVPQNENHNKNIVKMCLAVQNTHKNVLMLIFDGKFNFLQYSQLCNQLLDANEKIAEFIVGKIN